ncbi:Cof-type HAD-IIB family hydrolase [Aquibacillus halophilus]|uniref:Cof-type HAD-IIB family hydrolase n=2 Tax=Aquibacillus halophilus TaxID=930132 RepID=A0A6A8DSP1_9BACI|nr:HAD family hydrolase [Aquibacillus halophilus]MRH44222.1 Cof-type HAD-IIB family hydrolase [Aquibacillus halophilus]
MDGTILNHYNQVTQNTKQVIDDLRDMGILVFIATGRSFGEIAPLVPAGFKVDGIISSNGMMAQIDDDILIKHTLPIDLVKMIIDKARENKVYYELFPIEGDRISLKEDKAILEAEILEPKPDSVGINEWLSRKEAIEKEIKWEDALEIDNFSKFYFFSRSKEHINEWKNELEQLKKEIDFTTSISSEHNVEVMVANVNKGTGIKRILEEFGISEEETLVIGDSNNDLPMFKIAGYSVAMQNASDQIKQAVDEVTEFSCDEDGVCRYLKNKFQISNI